MPDADRDRSTEREQSEATRHLQLQPWAGGAEQQQYRGGTQLLQERGGE